MAGDIVDLAMALLDRGTARKDLRERLVHALSDQDIRDWARDLGQHEPNANSEKVERVDRLIESAARQGRARLLVRMARRSSVAVLREYAAQVQPVRFLPGDDLVRLRTAFEPFGIADWPALLKAARLYFAQESEWLPHDWNIMPLTTVELRGRIDEVVDALREQSASRAKAFPEPLLGFVRHLLCHADLRSRTGRLREWLMVTTAAMHSPVEPVALLAEPGARVDFLERRLNTRVRPLASTDNPWEAALATPAVRIVVVLGGGPSPAPIPDDLQTRGEFTPLLVLLPPSASADSVPQVLKDRGLWVRIEGDNDEEWEHAVAQLEGALAPEGPRIELFGAPRKDPGLSQALEQAVATIASQIRSPIVFVVGPAASCADSQTEERESRIKAGHVLARALLSEIAIVPANSHAHLPLAFAGELYSMKESRGKLLNALKVCSCLEVPATPRQLAALLKELATADRKPVPAPLVITTNFDLHLERAFLAAQLPFVRLVQGDKQCFVARHAPGSVPSANAVGTREMTEDELTELGTTLNKALRPWNAGLEADVGEDATVVLYKYFGSIERESTCVVALSNFESRADAVLPNVLLTRASNDQLVLLGYTVLDPEVAHLLKTLLRERVGQDANLAVQFPLTSDCTDDPWCYQRQLWQSMPGRWTQLAAMYRVPFKQVEASGGDFLKELSARIN